ncbi:WD40/YVTN/BNR-like repeat-containing protein [Streptomyces sp. NPDC057616]|uniref:WD40/YVTN/BNR-like repeat-containing protein n=1 Tax=Streptomyces sp. NPDC057616 TaxID=3346183 RepID=UPI0036B58053
MSAVVGMVLSLSDPAVASPVSGAGHHPEASPRWHFTQTATSNTLIAVDAVNRSTVWAVGGGFQGVVGGAVVRSVDGGRSWRDVTPPGAASDDIRDVEAFDRDHALVLALNRPTAGVPARIYRTADGGASWQQVFRAADPEAFFSSMAFFDRRHGLAVGDAVGTKFPLLETTDGGRSWRPAPSGGMPDTVPGNGVPATGTSLITHGRHDAWFGTTSAGAGHRAQVFHTRNGGRTWTVADTPVPDGANIASLSFRNRRDGLAVGGNFSPPDGIDLGAVVRTSDGGASWALGGTPAGLRNGVAWIPGRRDTAIAVGPDGSDITTDGGRTWSRFDRTLLLGINCSPHGDCWAVGEGGVAARLGFGAESP